MPSHNKQTHNRHFSHNKHAFFALTKMYLFGVEEDFGKNSLYFFNIESLKTYFLIILEKSCNTGQMRNPPLLIISTFSPNKHFYHNKHTFLGLTKMCLL